MIFISKNESGLAKSDWIASLKLGAHFVTRRKKPVKVGVVKAIQPGRGMKGIAKGKVVSCMKHTDWSHPFSFTQIEAELEGFNSWEGLVGWLEEHGIDISETYRVEMVKVA